MKQARTRSKPAALPTHGVIRAEVLDVIDDDTVSVRASATKRAVEIATAAIPASSVSVVAA